MSWDDSDDDWESNLVLNAPPPKEEDEKPNTFSDEEEVVDDDEGHAVEGSKPRTGPAKLKVKKKSKKQLDAEKAAQLKAEQEAAEKMAAMTPEERMAEKLRLQKIVEEADNKLTDELFSVSAEKVKEGIFDADVCAATLQTIPLESEQNFKDFASAVSKRLELNDNQLRTREFIKELIRSIAPTLEYEDLAEIDSVLSVFKNAKVKKKLNKKKKKINKPVAKVRHDMFDFDASADYGNANGDDYDFM